MKQAQPEHEIVVLITSAAHRRASLASTLEGLAEQTVLPDRVFLRLDGYRAGTEPPIPPALLDSTWIWHDPSLGAGRRWWHPGLDTLHPRSILHTIDDDLRPRATYIELTTALVVEHDAVITWHGWPREKDAESWAFYSDAPKPFTYVVTAGAGVSAYRWAHVRGLREHVLSQPCLLGGPQCDDDALLSVHLYANGVRMVRPGGLAPLTELPDSRGAGASFKRHAGYRQGQRLALAFAYSWPGLDHVLPTDLCEAYRKTTPGSLVEEGFASVLYALPHAHAVHTVLRLLETLRETPNKQRPAFGTQLLSPLFELTFARSPRDRGESRALFVGLGRWSVWSSILLRATGVEVEHLTVSREACEALPDCAGDVRSVGDYRDALDAIACRPEQYDLVVIAPHQHHEVVDLAHTFGKTVIELAEGMEQA